MKWGVRNDRGHQGERARTKKIARLDKKFARRMSTPTTTINLHNRAADLTNKNDVKRINNKPQYKGQDFSRDSALRQKYYKEHQKAFLDNLEKAANEMGTNASGTKRYRIVEKPNGGWDVFLDDVKHDSVMEMSVKVSYDDTGHITSIAVVDPMVHNNDASEFLEHYGVRGMHWGVRNNRSGRNSSGDFKKTKDLRKRKPHELTDKQLKRVNERINLEMNYSRLNPTMIKNGQRAVRGVLGGITTAATVYSLVNSPFGKASIAAGKHLIRSGQMLKFVK